VVPGCHWWERTSSFISTGLSSGYQLQSEWEGGLPLSRWRDVYRRLRDIEQLWPVTIGGPEGQVFKHALSSRRRSLKQVKAEASYLLVKPPRGFWEAAQAIRPVLIEMPDRGRDDDDPHEDVYEAAVSLTIDAYDGLLWHSRGDPDFLHVYRGSNNHEHAVIPWIFRDRSEAASREAWKRLSAIVARLRMLRPDLSEEQAVAFVQHYKDEAGVGTWLIDVTWDLRVALFFASLAGRSGKLGVVAEFSHRLWKRLSAGGLNRLGDISLIDVPGVDRIRAQRALFIDTSHPELLDQYVPFSRWFRQHDGVVFEDVAADPSAPVSNMAGDRSTPVSQEALLPTKDASLQLIASALPTASLLGEIAPLTTAPDWRPDHPLTSADYLEIALSWIEARGWKFDEAAIELIPEICEFHAGLQRFPGKIIVSNRSLHRLEEAVERLTVWSNPTPTLREVLTFSYYRGDSYVAERIEAFITEAEHS
jgi:hypothetical protein